MPVNWLAQLVIANLAAGVGVVERHVVAFGVQFTGRPYCAMCSDFGTLSRITCAPASFFLLSVASLLATEDSFLLSVASLLARENSIAQLSCGTRNSKAQAIKRQEIVAELEALHLDLI